MSLSTKSAEAQKPVVNIEPLSASVDTGDKRHSDARHSEAVSRLEKGLVSPLFFKDQADRTYTLEERMQFYNVPGVSVALIENGEIAWVKSWGVKDVNSQEPVTTQSIFQAASISKPLSAFAALRMVESGHLSLDQPINHYLKQWQLPENTFTQQVPVTLTHLLSHTGGVTVHGFHGYAQSAPQPTVLQVLNGEAIAQSDSVEVNTLPGTQFRYSGGGSTVFQVAMEDVSQQSFTQLMQDLVLTPTGMTSSTYEQPLPKTFTADIASGHLVDGSVVAGLWHNYPTQSAASLWTTPTDLAKFSLAVINASKKKSHSSQENSDASQEQSGVLQENSDALFSKNLCEKFLTNQKNAWGLGPRLFLEDGTAIGFHHGGANAGYRCNTLAFLDGRGAVIMTNSDAGNGLVAEMQTALAELYDWPAHKRESKAWLPIAEAERTALTGVYSFAYDDVVLEVKVELCPEGLTILTPWYPNLRDFLCTEQDDDSSSFTSPLGSIVTFGENEKGQRIVTSGGVVFIQSRS